MIDDYMVLNQKNAPIGTRLLMGSLSSERDVAEAVVLEWSPKGYVKVRYTQGQDIWLAPISQNEYYIVDILNTPDCLSDYDSTDDTFC